MSDWFEPPPEDDFFPAALMVVAMLVFALWASLALAGCPGFPRESAEDVDVKTVEGGWSR